MHVVLGSGLGVLESFFHHFDVDFGIFLGSLTMTQSGPSTMTQLGTFWVSWLKHRFYQLGWP